MNDFLSLHDADQIEAGVIEAARGPSFRDVVTGIVRHPARTLCEVITHPSTSHAVALSSAGGVYWAVNAAIAQGLGRSFGPGLLFAAVVVLGALGGIAYLYALSILISWACDVLGGEPTRAKVRSLLAVAGIPGVIALVAFGLPRIALFGHGLFMPDRPWLQASPLIVWGLWFGDAICFSWSLMLVVRGLKMMNGFSTPRAMMAAVLPAVPIVLIGLLFLGVAWTGVFFAPPAF